MSDRAKRGVSPGLRGPPAGSVTLDQALKETLTAAVVAQAMATEELRQSEERYQLLVDSIRDYAIIMLDPAGRVITWNEGARRIKGYDVKEIIGRHFSVFYPPEEVAALLPERLLETAAREGQSEDEGWRVRKDGSLFWADVVITALRDREGQLVGYGKVTRDVSERKRAEISRLELVRERAARDAAEKAVCARDEFLSVAAHELKTPVTSLRLHAQVTLNRLTRSGSIDPERLRQALEGIDEQSQKLARLIDQLLDVSRLSQGRLALDRTETDVVALVSGVVQAAQSMAPDRGLTLAAPPRLLAVVDPVRLEQVVTNLVNNAIKYDSSGGPIEVTVAQPTTGTVEIAVRDHGPGVPDERRNLIFDPFYQADSRQHRSGMGLGLFVSRNIVLQHGGQIRAEFPRGGGSRFVVTAPRTPYLEARAARSSEVVRMTATASGIHHQIAR